MSAKGNIKKIKDVNFVASDTKGRGQNGGGKDTKGF